MNTTALQSLANHWPHDTFPDPSSTKASFALMGKLFENSGRSAYNDMTTFDTTDQQAIEQFARDNGMTYLQESDEDLRPKGVASSWKYGPAWGGMLSPSTSPVITHVVSGKLLDFDVSLSVLLRPHTSYKLEVATAENRLDRTGVIRVKLPKLFPQLLLDSNKNDQGSQSSVTTSFKSEQRLALEGNFAQYYDFFAPRGLQVNALTVLAPNFMQMLIDASTRFDVEFYGNEMVLTTTDMLYTPKAMEEVMAVLTVQLGYLQRLMASWNYRPQMQPFDMLERSTVSGTVIKFGSHRIQPSVSIGLFVAFFFGMIILTLIL